MSLYHHLRPLKTLEVPNHSSFTALASGHFISTENDVLLVNIYLGRSYIRISIDHVLEHTSNLWNSSEGGICVEIIDGA